MKRKWFENNKPRFFCAWKVVSSERTILERLSSRAEARLFSEMYPHCIQCILILAMAVERYIIICLPTRSKFILSRKKRLCFYVIITLTLVLLGAFFAAAYRTLFSNIKGLGALEQNKLRIQLTVGSHVFLFFSCKSVVRLTRALFSRQDQGSIIEGSR